jgi:AraC-like DNA-binding protein
MNGCNTIRVDPTTRHEKLDYISLNFPYQTDVIDLHHYPGNTFPWHWHREIEVFYMRRGRLEYHLPGEIIVFEEGQGGFINSNVLHKTVCRQEDDCLQVEHQFTPEFIGGYEGSLIMHKYVRPILDAPGLDIVKLDPSEPDHRPLLDCMHHASQLFYTKPEAYELALQQTFLIFWQKLHRITLTMRQPAATPVDSIRIKQMLSYIADHYDEHICLEDIAAAAYLSPRACNRCFQDRLGTTPFAYLLDYRVQRACELLTRSDSPIGEIALQCGFSSSSYFCRVFREKVGKSPNAYRKEKKNTIPAEC